MRITYLKLKNFLHIYSGLNKTEVEIDLRNSNKVINIIIGKMGSCKSVILGHLQPFSGFGTLDARSQDGIILEGENGEKIIDYEKGDTHYHIVHKYYLLASYIERQMLFCKTRGFYRRRYIIAVESYI